MDQIESAILKECQDDFTELKKVASKFPKTTFYRHVRALLKRGLLLKNGHRYKSSEEGVQLLNSAFKEGISGTLDALYPPLKLLPSPVHKALAQLIMAAVVARQHVNAIGHYPAFVIFGPTLRYKTSLGVFLSYCLGVKPEECVLDLGSEAGKSIWLRRTSSGETIFRRSILEAPFVVFDEFLAADAKVRAAVSHFTSGRKTIPLENELVTVRPVALLTLNPRKRNSLEEKTSFKPPQLRRLVLADVGNVAMPDLAMEGHEAIVAAKEHPPITINTPKVDCSRHRRAIVKLLRKLVTAEAHEVVDTEAITMLSTGMTAFVDNEEEAIKRTVFCYCTVAKTLGWIKDGWVEPVPPFHLPEEYLQQPKPRKNLRRRKPSTFIHLAGGVSYGYRDA